MKLHIHGRYEGGNMAAFFQGLLKRITANPKTSGAAIFGFLALILGPEVISDRDIERYIQVFGIVAMGLSGLLGRD